VSAWIESMEGHVRIRVRVQPRASRTAIAGEHGGALRIRIAAPPVDGEANAELVRFLAKTMGVPAAAVRIRTRGAGRTKLIDIDGVSAAVVRARLLP
jgi:hypothetical protein